MNDWIDKQTELMLNDDIEKVIGNIKTIPFYSTWEEKDRREKLLSYYQTNMKRIRYISASKIYYWFGRNGNSPQNHNSEEVETFRATLDEEGSPANSEFAVLEKSNNWSR